uniref:RNA polymerase, sigma-24 subunit, ECF subfamily n=1 Tax=Solibacter usitatus (strain Ellin6076) TaxID=234267 RepID=Q027T9_SOLUE
MSEGSLSPREQADLAERIRAGEPLAEEELVRRYHARILAALIGQTRDREASRDLAQDVLIIALGAVRSGRVNEPEKLGLYILGIARILAKNHIRKRIDQQSREEELPAEVRDRIAGPLGQARMEEAERERSVREALDELPGADREIVLLTLDGRKPREIAATLGMAPDVVRQRKSRAIQKIALSLGTVSQTGGPGHL